MSCSLPTWGLLLTYCSLTSRLLDPIKALGKTGLFGNVFNKFDGGVEVLDDLDDHWTAKNHKDERKIVIEDLQDLAADRSVRITILGYVLCSHHYIVVGGNLICEVVVTFTSLRSANFIPTPSSTWPSTKISATCPTSSLRLLSTPLRRT